MTFFSFTALTLFSFSHGITIKAIFRNVLLSKTVEKSDQPMKSTFKDERQMKNGKFSSWGYVLSSTPEPEEFYLTLNPVELIEQLQHNSSFAFLNVHSFTFFPTRSTSWQTSAHQHNGVQKPSSVSLYWIPFPIYTSRTGESVKCHCLRSLAVTCWRDISLNLKVSKRLQPYW